MWGIDQEDIFRSLVRDNPWWDNPTERSFLTLKPRAYFNSFKELALQEIVRRSVVLMGPRRVGKTVMLHQLIRSLLDDGLQAKHILYASLDTPVYRDMSLENLLRLYQQEHGHSSNERSIVIFDEIQYLKDWEIHLKSLTDRYPNIRFIASGSAAAVLKLKSQESGAGRFTDFLLPPLTFFEYLRFWEYDKKLIRPDAKRPDHYRTNAIQELNKHFLNYLNYGGYPEIALSKDAQNHATQYLRHDVIGKVLARDLPNLYGIRDTQELERLLLFVTYHSGKEITHKNLSESSGITRRTIARYLEYLEAAFLIMLIQRVDNSGKHFRRASSFKIFLANPSMRTALYAPLTPDSAAVGHMVETAIFSQLPHSNMSDHVHYARWGSSRASREVDLVTLDPTRLKPKWAYEIKWSDQYVDHPEKLKGLMDFARQHDLKQVGASTKTRTSEDQVDDITIKHTPSALLCYEIGRQMFEGSAPNTHAQTQFQLSAI